MITWEAKYRVFYILLLLYYGIFAKMGRSVFHYEILNLFDKNVSLFWYFDHNINSSCKGGPPCNSDVRQHVKIKPFVNW